MDFNIEEFEYRICKGRVQSYVARAKEPAERIIKSIQTFLSNARIKHGEVERMLNNVQRESVIPFLGPPWNQRERQQRFQLIKDALIAKPGPENFERGITEKK